MEAHEISFSRSGSVTWPLDKNCLQQILHTGIQAASMDRSIIKNAFVIEPFQLKRKRRCLGLKSYATASPLDQQEPSWFPSAGIECSKAKLSTMKGLRGMTATEELPAGEIFASVPHDSALVLQPAKKCPFPDFCAPEYWKKAPWFVKLGLMLLYERHVKQGNSRHARYVEDLLAIKIETPLVWSQPELRDLQYPWLQEQIQKQIDHWTSLFERFQQDASCSVNISKEEFFWGLQAVRSRAFSGPYGGPPLKQRAKLAAALGFAGVWSLQIAHLPIEQVLNAGIAAVLFNIIYDVLMAKKLKRYALLPASDISYEIFRDSFTVQTNTTFKKGEEVQVSYGKHNNDYLLQFFGFYIKELSYDSYTITTAGQKLEDGTELPKQIILNAKGLSRATKEWVKQCPDPNTAKKAILTICEVEKKSWATTLQEDKKNQKYTTDDRSSLISGFRLEKKTLLDNCIRTLQR